MLHLFHVLPLDFQGSQVEYYISLSLNSVVDTWCSYGSSERPGDRDRGAQVPDRIHRYFRGCALACSFRLSILVVSGWPRPA